MTMTKLSDKWYEALANQSPDLSPIDEHFFHLDAFYARKYLVPKEK